jgi:hypothetical protein
MKMPEGQELREEILKEAFPRLSPRSRRLVGDAFHLWGRLRGISNRYERPSVRSARG